MANNDATDPDGKLSKGLFGYKRGDVERMIVEHEEQLRGMRKEIDTLWIAFAEHDRAVRESLEADGAPAPRVAPWAQRREKAAERMARAADIRTGTQTPAEKRAAETAAAEHAVAEADAEKHSAEAAPPSSASGDDAEAPAKANAAAAQQRRAEDRPQAVRAPQGPRSPQAAAARPPLGAAAEGELRPGGNPLPQRINQQAGQQADEASQPGPSEAELAAAAEDAEQRRAALSADLADLEAAMKAIETATKALERNATENPS